MIYGIGTDIVMIERIVKAIEQNKKFAEKILNENELKNFENTNNKNSFLAKRFAAKEAFGKACGIGIRSPILFKNIEVINNNLGKPELKLSEEIQQWLEQNKIQKCHISISDEKEYAIAFVILEHKL